ncbi:hypothetical protein Taro_040598 [Colocasia esculenta]|uniref:Alcohol dehydrogenase n=1 Tax=Colocasia esculenta TaxID=4460 RepID=A0A843WC93_COLES|nr:hypothetical protein [Colocasia esculenta]
MSSTPEMAGKASQIITCKAAVCWGPEEPLKVEEIQVEPPRASELRVRMICASTCHTDILCWNGFPAVSSGADLLPEEPVLVFVMEGLTSLVIFHGFLQALFPRVMGHEGVGVVESVGEGVTGFKEGDTVIPTVLGECGECPNCVSNKTNLCFKHPVLLHGLMPDGTSRMSVRGQPLYHLINCSTFSEYMVVDASFAVKVPPRLQPEHATLFSCGFATGFGAVWKEAKLEEGSTAAVFGLGGVGMGVRVYAHIMSICANVPKIDESPTTQWVQAIAAAKSLGAAKIIGVDVKETRREKAVELGMTDFINPKELDGDGKTTPEAIKEMTGGLGVDYSIECSGAAPLVNQAFQATVPGKGVTIVVGASNEVAISINLLELIIGKMLKGSLYGGIKPQTDIPVLFDKCINEGLPLDGLVTHEVGLGDVNHAYELLKLPECLKVLITFDGAKEYPSRP